MQYWFICSFFFVVVNSAPPMFSAEDLETLLEAASDLVPDFRTPMEANNFVAPMQTADFAEPMRTDPHMAAILGAPMENADFGPPMEVANNVAHLGTANNVAHFGTANNVAHLGASSFGSPMGASSFGSPMGASSFGSPMGASSFGSPMGASSFGSPMGASSFGSPMGASSFGSPMGASSFGSPMGASSFGSPMGASNSGSPMGVTSFGAPAGAAASILGNNIGAIPSAGEIGQGGYQGGYSAPQPIINRQIYVFAAPEQKIEYGPAPKIPTPRVDYNIVFVKSPAYQAPQDAMVAPAPQQKTLVYVLNKKPGVYEQKYLEAPVAPTHKPEVYYVNYDDYAENQMLPGGVDLQSALRAQAEPTRVITGDTAAGF